MSVFSQSKFSADRFHLESASHSQRSTRSICKLVSRPSGFIASDCSVIHRCAVQAQQQGHALVTPKQRPIFSAPQHCLFAAEERPNPAVSEHSNVSNTATITDYNSSSALEEPSHHHHIRMIDTIALETSKRPDPGLVEDLKSNRNSEWTTRSEELRLSWNGSMRNETRAYNKDRKQTVVINNDGHLKRLECSATRRLHGTNGIHLKTDDDVHRARAALLHDTRYFVSELGEEDVKVCRLDLALTIHTDSILLDLHRHATHPMVRREKELYFNEGKYVRTEEPLSSLRTVRFRGVHTVIQFYDKLAEVCQKKGKMPGEQANAVRVEIQLKGAKHIARQFGWKEREFITLADLELETCYQVYRRILLRFEKIAKIPTFKPGTASFVAILENYPVTWRHMGGMEPLDWVRRSKGLTDKHFKALRREVSNQRLDLKSFHWADLLPEHRLPDLVDIDGNGVATIIPSPWSFA